MKDRYFYPLAAIIIGAMIAYALSFKVDNRPSNVDLYERQGVELEEFFPSPGTTVLINGPTEDGFAVMSAHMSRDLAPPSAGVFVTLGPDYEGNFGGAKIRITVKAKMDPGVASRVMELGYFTAGAGDSEWQRFELTDEYADYSFDYTPNRPSGKGSDYVGIWPDPSGKGGQINVKAIKVERLRP